jgi:cobalt/nickel transport system permease protein
MSEKVHMAMMSRGYNGEVRIIQEFKMRNRDYVAGAIAISMSVVLVLISQNIIRV